MNINELDKWTSDNGLLTIEADPTLCWIDIETTGLYPWEQVPLEIGAILTDKEGDLCAEPIRFLIRDSGWTQYIELQNDLVTNMHLDSGLCYGAKAVGDIPGPEEEMTPFGAESFLLNWLEENVTDSDVRVVVAGSSIGFDRAFMAKFFSSFQEALHYRSVDVSSLVELAKMHNPDILKGQPSSRKIHRVIPDLVDSIHQYQFFLREFCMIPGEQS